MLKYTLAVALILAMTCKLPAQGGDFSNDLGKLFEEHAIALTKCFETEEFNSTDCRNESSLKRRLIDNGWCLKVDEERRIFQPCSVYRNYTISAELSGYQFGFERDSFSTVITSLMPTLAGTYEREAIGTLQIICSAGSPAIVMVQINEDYPDFAIRSDIVNFVAAIEGGKNIPIAPALLTEENATGTFIISSSEIAIRILEFYSKGLTDMSGDRVTLTFNSYEPRATLEFYLVPLLMGSFEALKHSSDVMTHTNALLTHCETQIQ